MIKTVTVASVLAAASVVQADILFDSTSTFNQVSVQSSPAAQVIGGSILTDLGNDRPYGEYPQYTITGAGSLSFVAGTSPDIAMFALYANDAFYAVGDAVYMGPGYRFDDSAFTFTTYQAGEESMISTTDFMTYDTPITYNDYNRAGLSFMITTENPDGIRLPFSQADSIYVASLEDGTTLGYDKDMWYGNDIDHTTWKTTLGLQYPETTQPFSLRVDGTATLVPEAGTFQLALMGLASLAGFAGLRRFKRD
ncbi:MAG: PEP-CTERM sorting domain-containing protein [Verrucomicrobia bacterium]|nr:PEP-CTERM sorting domain-containing protein [Verrucomicrobiota bacterium]